MGLHKEPSLGACFKLFSTNVSVFDLEMRWQRVPSLECNDTETVWTITCSPITWNNHVIYIALKSQKRIRVHWRKNQTKLHNFGCVQWCKFLERVLHSPLSLSRGKYWQICCYTGSLYRSARIFYVFLPMLLISVR